MRILVVDDHKNTRLTLGTIMRRSGHEVETVGTGTAAMQLLDNARFDIVITDLRLGDIDGMEVLSKARTVSPQTEVIVITAFGTITSAVRAVKLGAYDYVTKPIQRDQILSIVGKILEERHATGRSQPRHAGSPNIQEFIGQTAKIRDLLELVDRVAQVDVPVLLVGESGTGKELIARRIHQLSPRRDQPFVAINCGALPENLQESELFGHRKGSFTGAIEEKKGLLEEAGGGTVLLDEIAEMSLSTQVKFLRALQDGEIRPVGSNEVTYMKCRVLASTNKVLTKLVDAGRFRDDLLFRLNVMQIELPPLRERIEDVPPLVDHFVKIYNSIYGKAVTGVTPEALVRLQEHTWAGNVRELKNCIERAVFLCKSSFIDIQDLPQPTSVPPPASSQKLLKEQEKILIVETLRKTQWNQKRAAAELGIGETTLWRKIKKFGLKLDQP
jgi:DNA-binding NtrC family response regulator